MNACKGNCWFAVVNVFNGTAVLRVVLVSVLAVMRVVIVGVSVVVVAIDGVTATATLVAADVCVAERTVCHTPHNNDHHYDDAEGGKNGQSKIVSEQNHKIFAERRLPEQIAGQVAENVKHGPVAGRHHQLVIEEEVFQNAETQSGERSRRARQQSSVISESRAKPREEGDSREKHHIHPDVHTQGQNQSTEEVHQERLDRV